MEAHTNTHMKLSIFTPSHDPKFLNRCLESIQRAGSGVDWEWIVLLNGDARDDSRGHKWNPPSVNLSGKIGVFSSDAVGIGALKREACGLCTGDVLIELDHDDELLPGCLDVISDFMRVGGRRFFYSAAFELNVNGMPNLYNPAFGWLHSADRGEAYNLPFPITARSLCEIFYAPNHVRAWSREAYEAAGGYDAAMDCGDDHDLMCRTYLAGAEFTGSYLPRYRQHFHGANSQLGERNARIQQVQAMTRDKYLTPLIHEWCRREGLAMLDLGGAHNCPAGYTPVDTASVPGGIVWDVARDGIPSRPSDKFKGIGCIRAKDFLEHLPASRVIPTMNAIHQALVPGGWLLSMTPSTDGRGAFQDPTHTAFFNENSFWYYTQEQFAKYVPAITAKFQAVNLSTFFPGEWEKQHNIPYVQFNACAIHDGHRLPGLIGFPRK